MFDGSLFEQRINIFFYANSKYYTEVFLKIVINSVHSLILYRLKTEGMLPELELFLCL